VGPRCGPLVEPFWRRGGTGGSRRAHDPQWVASTGFSALQNGQNLISRRPRPARAPPPEARAR